MSIFIEIHCDILLDSPIDYKGVGPYCYSTAASSPFVLSNNSRDALLKSMKFLEQEAKNSGWIKTRKEGWICPNCSKLMKKGRK